VFSLAEHPEHGFLVASINEPALALLTAGSINALGENVHRVLAPELADLLTQHGRECLETRRAVAFTSAATHGPSNAPVPNSGQAITYLMTPLGNESRLISVTAIPCSVINRLPLVLGEQQRFATLGYLSRGVAHDVDNIVASARVSLADASRSVAEGSVTHQRLTLVDHALQLATLLLGKVLAFSVEPDDTFGSVDLTAVVSDAVNLVRPLLPRNVQLRLEFGSEVRPVQGSRSELMQVVLNLCLNAVTATEATSGAGGLTVSEKHISAPLRVGRRELPPGGYNCLCITDSGHGMSAETLQRAFEPFFTTKGSAAPGLGLSVVRSVVDAHGGAVVAHSTLGSGTTVLVYLPIRQPVAT
jgi:signal transduction histidine kinase